MSGPAQNSQRLDTARKGRWILIAAGTILLLILAFGLVLNFRYCLVCSDATRLERGADLLCSESRSAMGRGLVMIRQAAGNKTPQALALLGEIYHPSLPNRYILGHPAARKCAQKHLEPDFARSVSYFQKLAALDHLSGTTLYNLGILLKNDVLAKEDIGGEAGDYFLRSAEARSPFGLFALGWESHLRGRYALAAERFRASFSEGDHPEAAILLGDYHAYGHGVEKDRGKAQELYRRALQAAKKPAFQGLIGNLELEAQKRLKLFAAPQGPSAETEPIEIRYRLDGGPGKYLVFVNGEEKAIGRVVRLEGTILAREEGNAQPAEQRVASMAEGLDWVLETYAANRYGRDHQFRFRVEEQ